MAGTFRFLIVPLFALSFLVSCEAKPNQAVEKPSAIFNNISYLQLLHIYGWAEGNPQLVDTENEVNADFYQNFWQLREEDRYELFRSLPWPALVAFSKRLMNDLPAYTEGQPVEELSAPLNYRYFEYLGFMSDRYKLEIKNSLRRDSFQYLLALRKAGSFDEIEIFEQYSPTPEALVYGTSADTYMFEGNNRRIVIDHRERVTETSNQLQNFNDDQRRVLAVIYGKR